MILVVFKSLACSEHLLLVAAVLATPDALCAFLFVYKLMEKYYCGPDCYKYYGPLLQEMVQIVTRDGPNCYKRWSKLLQVWELTLYWIRTLAHNKVVI